MAINNTLEDCKWEKMLTCYMAVCRYCPVGKENVSDKPH
jgi:hypothetical protein